MLFKRKPTEKQLVGVWKHQILASWGSIEVNNQRSQVLKSYNYEIFNFRANGTFTFGEYGQSNPLYEYSGRWALSNDKTRILFTFANGESSSIDIRNFKGDSFVTTSMQGQDFKYVKQ